MSDTIICLEGIMIEVDCTPPWWSAAYPDPVCWAAAMRALADMAMQVVEVRIGMDGIRVRLCADEGLTAALCKQWRIDAMTRLDALPEMQNAIALHDVVSAEIAQERRERRV